MTDQVRRRENRYRLLYRVAVVAIVLVAVYAVYSALRQGDRYAASQAGLALGMLTIPAILARVFRFPIPYDCRLLYSLFVFCTVVVGSALYGYSRIPNWDKVFHFLSGLLIAAAGLMLCQLCFQGLSGPRVRLQTLYVLVPFLFNLAVAAVWEIYEYGLYVLFGVDAVNNGSTGVHDTLQDMIVCLVGGILFSLTTLWYCRKGKRTFLIEVCFHFFAVREKTLELPGPKD